MEPIVIFGSAVQDARNRIRSAQISAMYDLLGVELFRSSCGSSSFAFNFSTWVDGLEEIPPDPQNSLQKQAADRANKALLAAKTRNADFMQDLEILDVFAIGDVLRYIGEFVEFGGGALGTVTTLNTFRAGLRNQIAFNKANRARSPVSGYDLSLHPDLGIFRLELLDRSTVKYMERFYGPYVGADISGTTTDALDVLAFYVTSVLKKPVTAENLRQDAATALQTGGEMVPVACMVLQYHHSLLECGLALSLPSAAMASGSGPAPALPAYNLYDYSTLTDDAAPESAFGKAAARATEMLARDLAGCGLIILRDAVDVLNSPYADVEISVLMPNPGQGTLFEISGRYSDFAAKRQQLMLINDLSYLPGDPSLAQIANQLLPNYEFAGKPLTEIVSMNSVDLANWAAGDGAGSVFANLNDALSAAREAAPAAGVPSNSPHADFVASIAGAASAGARQSDVIAAEGDAENVLDSIEPESIADIRQLVSPAAR